MVLSILLPAGNRLEFPALQEQIHTLDDRGTGRHIHPLGFYRLIKLSRRFINGGQCAFTRARHPFEVKTNPAPARRPK
jgi:hypothetical protein